MFSRSPIPTCLTLLTWALLAAAAAGAQTTWHVDDDAPNDPGPGDPTVSDPLEDGSAEHPFDAIQEGIDAAVDDDMVLVADGTYTGVGNRDLEFEGRAITVRSANGPEDCTIDCEHDGRGFFFHSGETAAAIVEGFTITNGWVYSYPIPNGGRYVDEGTAIRCTDQSSPTITGCVLVENVGIPLYCDGASPMIANCAITRSQAYYGVSILCTNSNVTIVDCAIVGNKGPDSAGICCYGGAPTIIGCTISENAGTQYAPGCIGLHCVDADATIADCTITLNGGDGISCSGGSSSITGCTIVANGARGIWCSGSTLVSDCTIAANEDHGISCSGSPTIADCLISANRAIDGAGVACGIGTPTFSRCTITLNTASSRGGGIRCNRGYAVFADCVITANEAGSHGGAIDCYRASPRFINCTITGNLADVAGGGIYCDSDSTPTIANCILWGDSPGEIHHVGDVLDVTYSDVQGGYPGEGNLNLDPVFALSYDPRLMPDSPCIDAGTNEPPGGLPADDFDGNPRALDGNGDGDAVADMGAYEFDPNSPAIACSPAVFEFVVYIGDPNPHERTLNIRNCGPGTLNWEILEEYPWLSVDTLSGQSSGETDTVVLSVDANELAQGLHVHTFTVSDPQAVNSPQTILILARVWTGYPVIQTLVDAAADGDTVIVADGLYTGPGNKNLDFGGKAITLRSAGGPENCVIDCQGDGRGFHFHCGETADSVVGGFTVMNGYGSEYEDGGAVLCEEASSPVFSNCVFRQNMAITGAGGVGCYDSSPTFVNCTIMGNAADGWEEFPFAAGGVDCRGGSTTFLDCSITENRTSWQGGGGVRCWDGNLTFSSCTIAENQAWEHGGGIYTGGDGNLTIADCTITQNTVGSDYTMMGYGGGIACNGNVTITGCTISGNTAWQNGGGISYSGSGDLIIADSTISENAASDFGGGLYCSGYGPTSMIVTNCVIDGNMTWGWGGGIHCDGVSPFITNCTITDNTAGSGGGVHCSAGSPTIANCEITANRAYCDGGGLMCYGSTAIANCTVSGNTASIEGGGVLCFSFSSDSMITNSVLWGNSAEFGAEIALDRGSSNPMTVRVSYSDVQGGQEAVYVADGCALDWGDGNIDADPLFADPNDANHHLSAGSPCIDAGCNCAVPSDALDLDGDGDTDEFVPFDLDGEGRFFDDPDTSDTGSGLPPIVDMGAYEFGGSDLPPCRGDLDGDRDVDFDDLMVLLGHYGMTSGANGTDGDMDCDGDVELSDLAELLGAYGDTCE